MCNFFLVKKGYGIVNFYLEYFGILFVLVSQEGNVIKEIQHTRSGAEGGVSSKIFAKFYFLISMELEKEKIKKSKTLKI